MVYVMDGSWSWGNGGVWELQSSQQLTFCILSAGKVAQQTGKVLSATSQLEATLKRLRDV